MYHYYHGDTKIILGWQYETKIERRVRTRQHNQRELIKWIKNPDYEPIFEKWLDQNRFEY